MQREAIPGAGLPNRFRGRVVRILCGYDWNPKAFSSDGDWTFCNFGLDGGWAACDQPYHIDEINYLIAHPGDWLRYPDPWQMATFPGFHLFVAMIARLLGLSALGPGTWLRLIPCFLGALVLAVLWRVLRDLSQSGRAALVLALPVLWSNYFLFILALPRHQNAAYLGYALLLLAYLGFPRRSTLIGLVGAATGSVRQICPVPLILRRFSLFRAWRGRAALGPLRSRSRRDCSCSRSITSLGTDLCRARC